MELSHQPKARQARAPLVQDDAARGSRLLSAGPAPSRSTWAVVSRKGPGAVLSEPSGFQAAEGEGIRRFPSEPAPPEFYALIWLL